MMKRIAVIGAGFCGLAISWYLLQKPDHHVTLFDSEGVGAGASGTAVGLLHPYAGAAAKHNWKAKEGMAATKTLLAIAQKEMPFPLAQFQGILRLALSDQQKIDFAERAASYSDLEWLSASNSQKMVSGLPDKPALFITTGAVIDTQAYLEGLFRACSKQHFLFIKRKIQSLQELKDFDTVMVATGAAVASIEELKKSKIKKIKGQILEYSWPKNVPPLSLPINSQAYIVMKRDRQSAIVGATFERDFSTEKAQIDRAKQLLQEKALALFPPLAEGQILSCQAGIRASTPNHRPLIEKINRNSWLLTGMGSKGLLYHALFAKELVNCYSSAR